MQSQKPVLRTPFLCDVFSGNFVTKKIFGNKVYNVVENEILSFKEFRIFELMMSSTYFNTGL